MDREKLRDIFRKYRAVGLVLLAGLLLLLLPTGKSSGQERQTSDDTQLYSLEETERRMAQLLGRMSGVGRVQVMLSLRPAPPSSWPRTWIWSRRRAVCGSGASR